MADLLKLFDFRMQEGIKSDYKPSRADQSFKREKEKMSQETGGSSFGKALESVSSAIQNKESIDKPQEIKGISGDKNLKEPVEKKEQQIKEIFGQLNLLFSQLQKINPKDKKVQKLEIDTKESVPLDSLIKMLSQWIESFNVNQSQAVQKSGLKPSGTGMEKESSLLIERIHKGLGQLKELLAGEPKMGKEIMTALQNGTIQITGMGKENKERRIFDVKIESGALKNSEKKDGVLAKDSLKIENLAQNIGENLQAKEFKEKLKSEAQNLDPKIKPAMKKEVSEKMSKKSDPESNSNKKETVQQFSFQEAVKTELSDKIGKTESPKELEKARRAELGREIISQIGEKVSGFIGKNHSQIMIQLKPEDLGNVKIMLELKNDVIKGRIVVENSEVKEILQENINQVKSVLQDSGIQLGELEVSTQQGNGQAFQKSFEEDKLQKTIAQNQKVISLFSDLRAYEDGNYVSIDDMNRGRIFLEA